MTEWILKNFYEDYEREEMRPYVKWFIRITTFSLFVYIMSLGLN